MEIRLKEWRLQRFLTVRALAEKAGVAYTTVVHLEAGRHRPTMKTIRLLAKALSVKPEQLVEWGPGDHAATRTQAGAAGANPSDAPPTPGRPRGS